MSFWGFKVKRNRREWLESKLQQWWDIFQCIVIFSSTWSGHLKVLQSCFRHEIAWLRFQVSQLSSFKDPSWQTVKTARPALKISLEEQSIYIYVDTHSEQVCRLKGSLLAEHWFRNSSCLKGNCSFHPCQPLWTQPCTTSERFPLNHFCSIVWWWPALVARPEYIKRRRLWIKGWCAPAVE